MKPQGVHTHEDRLLDFAYGEMSKREAEALEVHLASCPRCTEALAGIRGVRSTMAQLVPEPAPESGLDSLLAYAEQSARRTAAGPAPAPSRWRRWLLPVMGLASVGALGVVTLEVNRKVSLAPSAEQVAAPAPVADVKEAQPEELDDLANKQDGFAQAPPPPAAMPYPQNEMGSKSKTAAGPSGMVAKRLQSPSKLSRSEDWSNAGLGGAKGGRAYGGTFSKKNADKAPADEVGALDAPGAARDLKSESAYEEARKDTRREQASAADSDEETQRRVAESQAPKEAPRRSSLRLDSAPSAASLEKNAPYLQEEAEAEAPATGEPLPTAGGSLSQASEGKSAAVPPRTAAPVPVAKPEARQRGGAESDSVDSLAAAALQANRSGDRAEEARLLRAALSSGAQGRQRHGLLARLCDAELAAGRAARAQEACKALIAEAPDSSDARLARKRLEALPDAPAQAH